MQREASPSPSSQSAAPLGISSSESPRRHPPLEHEVQTLTAQSLAGTENRRDPLWPAGSGRQREGAREAVVLQEVSRMTDTCDAFCLALSVSAARWGGGGVRGVKPGLARPSRAEAEAASCPAADDSGERSRRPGCSSLRGILTITV